MPKGIYKRGPNTYHANCRGDIATQFWKRVNKEGPLPPQNRWNLATPCWIWIGGTYESGYGQFRNQRAHRVAYELVTGTKLGDGQLLHKCDNPLCVSPDHWFVGTPQDNMTDKTLKQRQSHVGSSRNPPKGERNRNAQLTEAKVLRARKLFGLGYSVETIHRMIACPISLGGLKSAITGHTWKYL